MRSKPLQKLSLRHDSIAEWLAANPEKPLKDCAEAFGVSMSMLYRLTNSDSFREYLRSRKEELFARLVPTMREKIAAVADMSLDKLAEQVEKSDDPVYALEVADKMLHRLGYAPTKGPTEIVIGNKNVQTNTFAVSREALEIAREKVLQNAGRLPSPEGV